LRFFQSLLQTLHLRSEFFHFPGQFPGQFPAHRTLDLFLLPIHDPWKLNRLVKMRNPIFGKQVPFMMMALLLTRCVDVCARMHQRRHVDFRRGKRLGKDDHLIEWQRPQRPEWMDEATDHTIPETLTLREVRFWIVEPGRRTEVLMIATTLLDPEEYSTEDIAELYGDRWPAELDLRCLKTMLNLNHVRCNTPAMVHRELWTTLLGDNLIRATAAAAAAVLHGLPPREISFTGTCQMVLSSWQTLPVTPLTGEALGDYSVCLLSRIAPCRVGRCPGRIEPRVLKRRRHSYPLMKEPRQVFKAKHQPAV
jgi:hypothetical protein